MQRVADSIDDLLDLRTWLSRQPVVALDTETTGVDVYSRNFRVRTIQFGNTHEAWFVPIERGWYGPIREMLDRYDGKLLVHNASFDTQALARHDINLRWHQIEDTMLAMRLVEPHKSAGLKQAATRHVSRTAAAGQDDLKKAMRTNKWDWATIPVDFPAYIFYSLLDVVLLARLWESDACKEGVASPVYGLEKDVRALCTRMERNGLKVDLGYVGRTAKEFEVRMRDLEEDLVGTYGIPNPRSPADLGRWVVANGGEITTRTPTGAVSTTAESLALAALTAPPSVAMVIDQALLLRKLTKIKSSYLDNFQSMADDDGFLHPSINTIAARTGRMSVRDPALQTLPADGSDVDFAVVREAVIPRHEGHKLVACDYSQIELRAIASASGDDLLIDAFLDSDTGGSDFFSEAMRTVYDDPLMPKTDRRRHGIKTLFYAFAYGAGINKIAATAKMPIPEMTEIRDKVLAKYPGMKTIMNHYSRLCKTNDGWIETMYGRKLWVDPDQPYKALNAFIQGSAADILKDHLVELGHAGFEDTMVVPVHDEIVFSLPEDEIEDARQVIRETMTDTRFAVPLLAEPSGGGDTWSEVK